ncbi:unnamed protein product [Brassicogethes aeneus]|uniref:Uncharacterized protein n=1 Tax=Brassicogethes aeneus TaxID=1431903 RepID=A0A9P0BBE1_BRAAE|nr:unnamed protein product [Brassicogethes aeneus]
MRTYKRKKENLKPLTKVLLRQAREMKERGISIREIGRTLAYDESTIRKRLKAGSGEPEGNNEAEEPIEEADNLPDRANVLSEPESPKPGCSREYESQVSKCLKENNNQFSVTVPSDIIPLPILTKKRKRTRKGLKSTLLTSTPNKEELENIEQQKRRKIEEKEIKASIKRNKTIIKKVFDEKENSLKKNEYQSSSESEAQFSLHDSSSDMNFSESDAESNSGPPGYTSGEFAVVKVCGKTKDSFRLYVIRIIAMMDDGCNGIYYKRVPNTKRFLETEEEFFVNRADIVRKLSKPLPGSSARFKDFVSFSTDLSDLMLH